MNKKNLLVFGLPILALCLVSAGLMAYFGQIKTTVDVKQPIAFTVNGIEKTGKQVSETVPCEAGETCIGSKVYRTTGDTDGVNVSYVGKLRLSKKHVEFGTSSWEEVPDTDVFIEYTVVGDEFKYSVESTKDLSGYVLIYYKDNSPRFDSPALASEITGSLPEEGDANIDTYSYCEGGEESYAHCHGAKLWLVPTTAINEEDKTLDWSQASNFYFETDLIYYFANGDGEITVPAKSFIEFYPQFSVDDMATEGNYVIYTTINPVE